MPRLATLILLLLTHASAQAISNIESQRPGPPPEGWSGHLEFSASGQSGNVEEDRYGLGGKLVFKAEENTVFAIIEGADSRSQGIKTTDEAFAHTRFIRELNETVSLEAFGQWQENAFANLLSRYLLGTGGRFELLSKPDAYSFSLGLGAFHEWERTDLGTYTEEDETWRLNTYWSYQHQLNEQVNWFNTVYLQPSLDDSDDYRVLFDTGLTVRLTGALQLRVSYNLSHNSQPPRNLAADPAIDRAETNTSYATTFLYEF